MIFGNLAARTQLQNLTDSNTPVIAVTGPSHVGKFSAVRHSYEGSCDPSDFLVMEKGVDGVREVIDFLGMKPLRESHRTVLIDNGLSEPAQDALLKITEEPTSTTRIVLVSHDLESLLPALRSRIRTEIRFGRLSDDEMCDFSNSFSSVVYPSLLKLSSGRPGFYRTMMENSGFDNLFDTLKEIASGSSDVFMGSVPQLIKDLKGESNIRDTVVHLVHRASRFATNTEVLFQMLKLCRTLSGCPSANAEIHWLRMTAHLVNVN